MFDLRVLRPKMKCAVVVRSSTRYYSYFFLLCTILIGVFSTRQTGVRRLFDKIKYSYLYKKLKRIGRYISAL